MLLVARVELLAPMAMVKTVALLWALILLRGYRVQTRSLMPISLRIPTVGCVMRTLS